MGSTIVDRILAEANYRKSLRDALLARKNPSAANSTETAEPLEAGEEDPAADLLSRFKEDVVPAIGRAVSGEISAALDKVRKELLDCLERELSRISRPSAAAVPKASELPPDNVDTDIDLPVDEVNRQLDKVFAEMDPVKKAPPANRAEPQPASEPPLASESQKQGDETESLDTHDAALAESPDPRIDLGSRPGANPPKEPPKAASPGPAAKAREARQEPAPAPKRGEKPAEESPGAGGSPESPEEQSDLVEDLREAILPGFIQGIAGIREEFEKAQGRIFEQVQWLALRIQEIEEKMAVPRISSAPPEAERPSGQPRPVPEVPTAPTAAAAAPAGSQPIAEGADGNAGIPEDAPAAILRRIEELEARLAGRIDSAAARLEVEIRRFRREARGAEAP